MSAAVSVCNGDGFSSEVCYRAYRHGIESCDSRRWFVNVQGVLFAEAVVDDFGDLLLIRDTLLLQTHCGGVWQ